MTPERALRALAWIARILSWPFARFDIAGGEALNHEIDEVVIVVDHRSMFDIAAGVIVFARYGRAPRLLVERRYVERSWTGPIARAIGAIPVDRAAGGAAAFDAARAELDRGATILILPEGRLHRPDPADPLSTGPASTGTARLAAATGVPVVAAGMLGTDRVWPPEKRWPNLNPFRRRELVTVRIADAPVPLSGTDRHADTEAIMAAVRAQMRRCQEAATAIERRAA